MFGIQCGHKMSKDVVSKIREKLGTDVLQQLDTTGDPKLSIPKRGVDNAIFDKDKGYLILGDQKSERRMKDISDVRIFAQTLEVASAIVESREQNMFPAIRKIYYKVKPTGLFSSKIVKAKKGKSREKGQVESDDRIKDIEVLTGMLREEMGLTTRAKGQIIGRITVEAEIAGEILKADLSTIPSPLQIPSDGDSLKIDDVKAQFVFYVEKDTEYGELVRSGFARKHNCLLVTASGQPDRGTRRFVRRLNEEHHLPVIVMTDLDPSGMQIFSVIRCGSISLSYESFKLACPKAQYLGMLPSDIKNFGIPEDELMEAEDSDIKTANRLLNCEWMKDFETEIKLFLKTKKKAELESFSSKGFRFLQEEYLPMKLKAMGIINGI